MTRLLGLPGDLWLDIYEDRPNSQAVPSGS